MPVLFHDFATYVADAYQNLYDLVYLRTHPLIPVIFRDDALSLKERGWKLHQILLDAVEELAPGPNTPPFSHAWRRYQLLTLRYIEGLDSQSVAKRLSISRRQYFRVQKSAIDDVARILWDRYIGALSSVEPGEEHTLLPPDKEAGYQLLKVETSRIREDQPQTNIPQVVRDALEVLSDVFRKRELEAVVALGDNLPEIAIDRGLLRQVLLGALGYLVERIHKATLHLSASDQVNHIALTVESQPPILLTSEVQATAEQKVQSLAEIAALGNSRISLLTSAESLHGFELQLPPVLRTTILVVDDNEDVLDLFRRWLISHRYQVLVARTAEEALDQARRFRPAVITLDLMMPQQDGWDLMRMLRQTPETGDIPIIVCSVLKQRDLALLLGAADFLEKPITEEDLLDALDALNLN
ncbi:MAG: response regulator [Anaerolineae bacterium]|nr:response regulator [Anaerolineae bacterium]